MANTDCVHEKKIDDTIVFVRPFWSECRRRYFLACVKRPIRSTLCCVLVSASEKKQLHQPVFLRYVNILLFLMSEPYHVNYKNCVILSIYLWRWRLCAWYTETPKKVFIPSLAKKKKLIEIISKPSSKTYGRVLNPSFI